MKSAEIGFAVIYRWRLHPGQEEAFQKAWATITELFLAERQALGSRLHQVDDGTWLAYAQWPDREAWEKSRRMGSADAAASQAMSEAVAESFDPILLDPVRDYLIGR